jgi:hypothetical protein
MKLAQAIVVSMWLGMTVVLVYGFGFGDFAGEGAKLLAMPWGVVSLADLYTGFLLFAGWIIYRERSTLNKLWLDYCAHDSRQLDCLPLCAASSIHQPRRRTTLLARQPIFNFSALSSMFNHQSPNSKHIAIIGTGIAGLTAAYEVVSKLEKTLKNWQNDS